MPVGRKLTKAEKDRLMALPRDPEATLQGTLRLMEIGTLPEELSPSLTLWVDGEGQVRASKLIEQTTDFEEQIRLALETLVEALLGASDADGDGSGPPAQPLEALPARVETDTPELLRPLRAMLQPLAVPVKLVEELPAVDAATTELAEFMAGAFETPPQPFEWEVDAALLPPLFRAAKAFYELAPWNQLPDHPPIMLKLGEHGPEADVPTLFASVLGGGGMLSGVAFYYSAEGMHHAMEVGARLEDEEEDEEDEQVLQQDIQSLIDNIERMAGEKQLTPRDLGKLLGSAMVSASEAADGELETEDSLVLYFDDREETNPSYLDWLKNHRVGALPREAVPTFWRVEPGGKSRPPNDREVRALMVALRALNHFVKHFPRALEQMLETEQGVVQTIALGEGAEKISVTATYPPPEEIWPEEYNLPGEPEMEPEEPASPAAMTTLYRFQVTFDDTDPPIWRRIEMRGDQTLHDLHEAIQDAFSWDDDHLYAFFLSRRAWDESSEYASPYSDSGKNAAAHRLENLPLKPRKKFLYIFDFGDELRHTVTLEAVVPGGVQTDVEYPRVTERHGENVPQYPDAEDDFDIMVVDAEEDDGDVEDESEDESDDE